MSESTCDKNHYPHDNVEEDKKSRGVQKSRQQVVDDRELCKVVYVKFVACADDHECQINQAEPDLHALKLTHSGSGVISFCGFSQGSNFAWIG